MLKLLLLIILLLCINLISLLSKKTSFISVIKALKAYKIIYGDFNIKYNFKIPTSKSQQNSEWPPECYGLRLGNIVSRIRNRGDYIGQIGVNINNNNNNNNNFQVYLENRKALKDIGFMIPIKYDDDVDVVVDDIVDNDSKLKSSYEFTGEFNRTLTALRIYHQLNGHVNVPTAFVVPDDYPWCNGNNNKIDNNHNHNHNNNHNNNYSNKNNVNNRRLSLSGLKLGKRLHSIKREGAHTGDFFKRHALEELGVDFKRQRERLSADDVLLACSIYKDVFGHLMVPHIFMIPKTDYVTINIEHNNITKIVNNTKNVENSNSIRNPWPNRFWGLHLGYRITHIRNRGSFRTIHEELTQLGFEWDAFRNKEFHNVLEALASALLEENMDDEDLLLSSLSVEDENLQEFLKNLK